MRHACVWSWLPLLLVFTTAAPAVSAEPITTATLLEEMVDMIRLADFPDPAYQTIQFSSHDRRSTLPGAPGWFANSDGFGNEPEPNFEAVLTPPDDQGVGEYLVCDVQAPGAIVRTWTAAIRGTIRMYLDDAEEPVFHGPAEQFFHRPYQPFAAAAGIDEKLFEGTFQQRDACYFPIPFAKRCRIVWKWRIRDIHFYEIQIRRYAPGTKLVTFHPEDLAACRASIRRVAEILSDPQGNWPYRSSQAEVPIKATIPSGETAEVLALKGPAAIERLSLSATASDIGAALRQTILHVVCDEFPWGQVQAPLGDFFGAAPGINPFNSVPLSVEASGQMTSRFVIPFARSCKLRLQNLSAQPVTITGSALPMDYQWKEHSSMHFRARWRVDHDLVASGGSGAQDLPFLLANGKGVYVGTAVMLLNPNPVPTPYGSWWGEGDEKVFVDSDRLPSTFGTGSEDYFNYSWSVPEIFGYPYCGQPRDDGPANRGFVVNHRWHILDALPFRQRIAFYMELYSHERTEGFSYARIGYHYGRPGLTDDHRALTREDIRLLRLPANWQPAARMGARGSTFYQAEDLLEDQAGTSLVEDDLWAGGQMLLWQPQRKGSELSFRLSVANPGRYVLRLTAAHMPRSGSFSAQLDGQPIRLGNQHVVSLRSDYRTLSRTLSSPTVELGEGDHRLTLRCEDGSSDQAPGTIGLDFIWLQSQ